MTVDGETEGTTGAPDVVGTGALGDRETVAVVEAGRSLNDCGSFGEPVHMPDPISLAKYATREATRPGELVSPRRLESAGRSAGVLGAGVAAAGGVDGEVIR